MPDYSDCTIECERVVECTVCHMRKPPVGRSVPIPAANGYCHWECSGYHEKPKPGHLWPGELESISDYEGHVLGSE